MAKEKIKTVVHEQQNGKSTITNKPLPKDVKKLDTHRKVPRMHGGTYTPENTIVDTPVTHMKVHSIFREREVELAELKMLVDARRKLIQTKVRLFNQLLGLERDVDQLDKDDVEYYNAALDMVDKRIRKKTAIVSKYIQKMHHPIAESMLEIHGCGPITIAECLVYLDPYKADYPSSFVAYAGLHKPAHERRKKNTINDDGHTVLRCSLWNFANVQVRQNGPYRIDYDRCKTRLEKSKAYTLTYKTGETGLHKENWLRDSNNLNEQASKRNPRRFIESIKGNKTKLNEANHKNNSC